MDLKFDGKSLIAIIALFASIASTQMISVASSTNSENNVIIEGLPIGSVVMWGAMKVPEGWKEMDGSSVSGYAKVSSIFGGTLPDLRGKFVRGFGGNSAAIGVAQGDAIKSHGHSASFSGNALPPHNHSYDAWGGGTKDGGSGGSGADNKTHTETSSSVSAGTPSGSVSVAAYGSTETRPRNVALK